MTKKHLCTKHREWIEDSYAPTLCPDFEKKRGIWKLPRKICYYCAYRRVIEVEDKKTHWYNPLYWLELLWEKFHWTIIKGE